MKLSSRLPDFPWDTIAQDRRRAAAHPDGIVDLSVGTPVDPTPPFAQRQLADSADAHGYPTVWGTEQVREAICSYLQRRWCSVEIDSSNVLPVVGTKELVAWLPTLLNLGAGDAVAYPRVAYPTYEVGALVAGCTALPVSQPEEIGPATKLVWINSPANPTGRMLTAQELRDWVQVARSHGAILASDECYGEFAWDREAISVLDPRINDGDLTGLLAVHSVSKRSNAAGYRAGFVGGDAAVVMELVAVRKHLGMMVPSPVQAALGALLADEEHVASQRQRYAARREVLREALVEAGFRIEESHGSLYLWATRDEPCRDTLAWLAERGILVAPGDFYGDDRFVRVALTASDERVAAAADRLRDCG